MSDRRTARQNDANRLDLDMYRLAGRMETFADATGDPHIEEAARKLSQARGIIRKHMHPEDREETVG